MMAQLERETVFAAICEVLQDNVVKTEKAARFAFETATAKENIAENKYDTLGLEAAYLAESQSARVAELKVDLAVIASLATRLPVSECDVGSLVTLMNDQAEQRHLLLAPCQGGLTVQVVDQTVQLVTLDAPVGKALNRSGVGDEVELATQNTSLEVVRIW